VGVSNAARLRLIARGPGRVVWLRAVPDLVEFGFVLVLCVGVGFVFWPAALMLFGVLGVVACERRSVSVQAGSKPVSGRSERVA
jgi:hypothetical protein